MRPEHADNGDVAGAPTDVRKRAATTGRDLPRRRELDELLRLMEASAPVIRQELVDAARARIADGEHPSADDVAITVIDESLELVDDSQS
jgi:hypothetical protein